MKKLLVFIPAMGLGLMACHKDKLKTAAKEGGTTKPTDLRMIVQGTEATHKWDAFNGNCDPAGKDCLDEVTCTLSFWDKFWNAYWIWRQGRDNAAREFVPMSSLVEGEPNTSDEDLRDLIGEELYAQVLSGKYQVKLRLNENKNNAMFLGIFDSEDQVKRVIPITKPE